MIRALYDWVFRLAEHKRASWALSFVSFIESSVFPIPPDVLLIPMVLARRARWIWYASLCTIASVLGAFLGYYIGAALYESVGRPVLEFYGKGDSFGSLQAWYNDSGWGTLAVLFAAITPFPYKVVTIFSGVVGLNLFAFVAISLVGRAFRFFLVSYLLYRVGEPIKDFIEKRLGLMFTLGVTLLIGGFVSVKYLIP